MDSRTSITTLSFTSEGSYKEKGSKFLAYAFPVKTIEEVKDHLLNLKREHPKARHHCYAYRLNSAELIEYAQDAGEPSGSAGLPILNALKSNRLSNALIIVVRYFGGSKLGIPGLINAYKQAAFDAIDNNKIIKRELKVEFAVKLPYEKLDHLYNTIAKCRGKVLEQNINTVSEFRVGIPLAMEKTFVTLCPHPIIINKIDKT